MKKLIALMLCVVCLAQSAFAASPAESARDLALSAVSGQKFLAGVSGELLAQGLAQLPEKDTVSRDLPVGGELLMRVICPLLLRLGKPFLRTAIRE